MLQHVRHTMHAMNLNTMYCTVHMSCFQHSRHRIDLNTVYCTVHTTNRFRQSRHAINSLCIVKPYLNLLILVVSALVFVSQFPG